MIAGFTRVSLKCLLERVRAVDAKAVGTRAMRAVSAGAKSDLDGLKGECSTVRLRDDDAKALRQVCAAILRFADEPISIQTGSREGAEGRVRELKGEKMGIMPVQRYRGQKMFQRSDFTPRVSLHQGDTEEATSRPCSRVYSMCWKRFNLTRIFGTQF